MIKVAELYYDIEMLYIEGLSAKQIAAELNCPIETVLGWIESQNVADSPQEDDYSPYDTINS